MSYHLCDQPILADVAGVNSWLNGERVHAGNQIDMLFWNLGRHHWIYKPLTKLGRSKMRLLYSNYRQLLKVLSSILKILEAQKGKVDIRGYEILYMDVRLLFLPPTR